MTERTNRSAKSISVVAPFYCEEKGAEEFLRALAKTLDQMSVVSEIVVVDDGSGDKTAEILQRAALRDPRIRVVLLSRNYGHQVALLAGLDRATGDVVVTMDSDFQHPPERIPEMMRAWEAGFDVVSMVKTNTEGRGAVKSALANAFYGFFNRVSRIRIHPNGSDFRLLDRTVLKAVLKYRQKQFFLRGIVADLGYRACALPYEAPARRYGEAQYTLRKLFELALRGIFSYSTLPLKLPLFFGAGALAFAVLEVLFGLWKVMIGAPLPQGWLSTYVGFTLVAAMIFIFQGVQGYYVAKIFEEVQERPLYAVRGANAEEAGSNGP